jgi:hypothetical protein
MISSHEYHEFTRIEDTLLIRVDSCYSWQKRLGRFSLLKSLFADIAKWTLLLQPPISCLPQYPKTIQNHSRDDLSSHEYHEFTRIKDTLPIRVDSCYWWQNRLEPFSLLKMLFADMAKWTLLVKPPISCLPQYPKTIQNHSRDDYPSHEYHELSRIKDTLPIRVDSCYSWQKRLEPFSLLKSLFTDSAQWTLLVKPPISCLPQYPKTIQNHSRDDLSSHEYHELTRIKDTLPIRVDSCYSWQNRLEPFSLLKTRFADIAKWTLLVKPPISCLPQ